MFKWSLFKNGVTQPMERNSIEVYTEKMQSSIFNHRTPHQKQSKARSILNNMLNNSLTDTTFDLVNEIANTEIVHLKVHRNQQPIPVVV